MKNLFLIILFACSFICKQSNAQSCPVNCSFDLKFWINGTIIPLSTTIATNLTCGQQIDIMRSITCAPASNLIVKTVVLYDALNNSPIWSSSLPNNILNIPAGVSGVFMLKYEWGTATTICGTSIYPLNISCTASLPCPSCTLTGNIVVGGNTSYNALTCGMHIPVTCGSFIDGTITQNCNGTTVNFQGNGILRKQPGNIYIAAIPYNLGAYTFSTPGSYTLTYPKSLPNGTTCSDSCTLFFDVTGSCTGCAPWLGKGVIVYNAANPPAENDLDNLNTPCNSIINANPNDSILIFANRDCIISGNTKTSYLKLTEPDGNVTTTTFTANPNDADNPEGAIVKALKATCGNYKVEMYTKCGATYCDTCKYTIHVDCNNCLCPTITYANIDIGGHCGIQDTIKNVCNKNIVSWTLRVNGTLYSDAAYPLTPQAIAANSTIVTGNIMLLNLPNTTIPLVYTFTYADGTTCVVNKQFNATNCNLPPLPCPGCTVITTATFQGLTVNLSNSSAANPVTLSCSKNYTLNNTITCSPATNFIFDFNYAYVKDNWNQNWAITTNATGTQLQLPGNMISTRTYKLYVRWYFIRGAGDTCFIPKAYPFIIACSPCNISCAPTVNVTGNGINLTLIASTNYAASFDCGKTYLFIPNLNCGPVNTGVTIMQIKVFDTYNNQIVSPPSWLQSFIANNGTGNLAIPAGTAGTYKVKYYYGVQNNICDSFQCVLDITCAPACPCTALDYFTSKTYVLSGSTKIDSASCGGTIPTTLGCNKQYGFASTFSVNSGANNCMGYDSAVIKTLTGALVTSNTNVTMANPITYSFTQAGTYTVTQYLIKNGVICKTCTNSVTVTCPPPICTTCTATVNKTTNISFINNNTTGISLVTQSFSFSGLPASITEVRVVVTNITIFGEDENGNKNEECLSCISKEMAWGSIVNGTGVNSVTPKININGAETIVPVSLQSHQNPRQITWYNSGNVFAVSNPLQLSFQLPSKSVLDCCTRIATICVKFIFRNDQCEECVVYKCFDVKIK